MKKPEKLKTLFERYVYQFDKINYFRTKKNTLNECILCNITNNSNNQNNSLLIGKSNLISVCVNLYPYNSGHIMLFPNRHIEHYIDLSEEENHHLYTLTKFFIIALQQLYNPSGFNIGMNIGENSGASIRHIHQHIVPRFNNELGMIDIIGGSKVIVESPIITMEKLTKYLKENQNKLPFDIF